MLLESFICQNTVKGWRVVGVLVTIIKILVPVIIIVTSIVPIFNSLLKGNADETIKSWQQIGRKIAAGVIVFLIPTLVGSSVKIFVGEDYQSSDVSYCVDCFANPVGDDCTKHVNDFDTAEEREAEEIKQIQKEEQKKEDNADESVIEGGSVDTNKMGTSDPSN